MRASDRPRKKPPRRSCSSPNGACASGRPQPSPRSADNMGATLDRVITDYKTLVEICRQRADELAISRLEIDRIGGLPSGYAGKLLGKDGGEPGRKNKKIWPIAMEAMLGALGLQILIIEDT